MTKIEFETAIAQAVAKALANQGVSQPKAATKAEDKNSAFAEKDKKLVRGFNRKGFKNVQLLDRNDPSKPFNVKTFDGWLKEGRRVKKGQHGIRRMFHVDQTEVVSTSA